MGPTASDKTEVALRLCERYRFGIVSVDSALVYRGMDIGTAKPEKALLERIPHRLIDIREPEESYSAGEFVRDAIEAMHDIEAQGQIPLLVGGTMMYFRALTRGIAELPKADEAIRTSLDAEAAESGWPALHAKLAAVDPTAAARLNPNDSQRIQRALEVYLATGKNLSEWLDDDDRASPPGQFRFIKLALRPEPRSILHARIETRLNAMLDRGFVDEVRTLMQRPGLRRDMPSMRAVGYRQIWAYLENECSLDEGRYRALVATRQLAKRQLTWLRSERGLGEFDPLEKGLMGRITGFLRMKGLKQN